MHVRLPLCNPPRTKQPYQLLESRTLPLPSLKKTSIVREDGLRVLCRNFLDSSLVVQFQISVSCREKAQQHRLLYILTIEFFLPSKEKYRIKIYSKLSESKFSSDFSLSLSFCLPRKCTTRNGVATKFTGALYKRTVPSSNSGQRLIRSRPVRSH